MAKRKGKQQALIDLGAIVLAEALLDLSMTVPAVADRVAAMLASERTAVRLFMTQLKAIETSNRYVKLRGSRGFSTELILLFENLKRGVHNPVLGMDCICALFEMDEFLFEECDHPDGDVGYALDFAAKEVFAPYATACPDREKVIQTVLKLIEHDEYGGRMPLLECAPSYLSLEEIRTVVDRLWLQASPGKTAKNRAQAMAWIRILAVQLKDPELYEKASLTHGEKTKPSMPTCVKIAQVYLDAGLPQKAQDWLDRAPSDAPSWKYERDQLQAAVQKALHGRKRSKTS